MYTPEEHDDAGEYTPEADDMKAAFIAHLFKRQM
jgi:hypothetical protein